MQKAVPSGTALVTSLMRAVHARCDLQPILEDSWGDRLLPQRAIDGLYQRALAAGGAAASGATSSSQSVLDEFLRDNSTYTGVITRSRYSEDALEAALANGVRQYVLIGAGFDSFGLRSANDKPHLNIFELDHPATQSLKIRRIEQAAATLPSTVQLIAADLTEEDVWSALSRSTFDRSKPAFFSWLGVTMYLSREANLATLKSLGQHAAAHSEIVFNYLDEKLFALETPSFMQRQREVTELGEPWVSGFDPVTLPALLATVGLKVLEDVDEEQLVLRYDPTNANQFRPTPWSRIVRAQVARMVP